MWTESILFQRKGERKRELWQGSYRLGRVKFKDFQDPFIRKFKDRRVEKINFGKQCPGCEKWKHLQTIWLNLQWQIILYPAALAWLDSADLPMAAMLHVQCIHVHVPNFMQIQHQALHVHVCRPPGSFKSYDLFGSLINYASWNLHFPI